MDNFNSILMSFEQVIRSPQEKTSGRDRNYIYLKRDEVDQFVYLRAEVCREGGGMKDLKNRLSKARGAFNKLKKIWISKNILRKTKVRLYKTLVVPVLLYGSETWKMTNGDDKAVNVFHNRCLRRILRIQWQDNVSAKELLERAGMKPLSAEVMSRRWKMIGHILRIDRNNNCSVAMGWAPEGKRRKGRPKNHLETYSRERKARGTLVVVRGGADSSNQSRGVEKLCEGPMCHEA
ncbi:hypothetical protein AWC38_SpisGene9604 [Stylophora pistillata]|uniref:Uncharacterized protein n=1 Tax=Stylophora pistillata TaxID=50429 RepID=A0A2B4S9J1_STYPI|nr:hypothetical protein AWC38_SpisGene9604 [Stylophora pistillata]